MAAAVRCRAWTLIMRGLPAHDQVIPHLPGDPFPLEDSHVRPLGYEYRTWRLTQGLIILLAIEPLDVTV